MLQLRNFNLFFADLFWNKLFFWSLWQKFFLFSPRTWQMICFSLFPIKFRRGRTLNRSKKKLNKYRFNARKSRYKLFSKASFLLRAGFSTFFSYKTVKASYLHFYGKLFVRSLRAEVVYFPFNVIKEGHYHSTSKLALGGVWRRELRSPNKAIYDKRMKFNAIVSHLTLNPLPYERRVGNIWLLLKWVSAASKEGGAASTSSKVLPRFFSQNLSWLTFPNKITLLGPKLNYNLRSYKLGWSEALKNSYEEIQPLWGRVVLPTPLIFWWDFKSFRPFILREDTTQDLRVLYQFPSPKERAKNQINHRTTNSVFNDLMRYGINKGFPSEFKSYLGGNIFSNLSLMSERYEAEDSEDSFNITRIRFKPGYSRIWRLARTNFKEIYDLKFRYQKPLTRYLGRLRRIPVKRKTPLLQMRLDTILSITHLFWNTSLSKSALLGGLIYLNGYLVRNSKLYIVPGDFIQTFVSIQYYISYMGVREDWHRHIWRNRRIVSRWRRRRARVPSEVFILEMSDIPPYLEVDFFSLSCFVLFETNQTTTWGWDISIEDIPQISYMYNWKYIN